MWRDTDTPSPLCFSDFQFTDRGDRQSGASDEMPPVDSAHVPPSVKLKKIAPQSQAGSFYGHPTKSHPTSQSTVVSKNTSQPSSDSMNSHRSTASFVYRSRAPRRGTCLIISVDSFKPALCLPGRPGADVDLQKLEDTFSKLDFDVKVYRNPTAADISNIVDSESQCSHTDADCFACVILTHGDEGGLVYGTDGAVHLDQLINPFRGNVCPSLAGKPKMFFIQACRGTQLDAGTLVHTDSPSTCGDVGTLGSLRRIPIEADLLVAYAVQPGYYAFRNSMHGSWFIQALTNCLRKYGRTLDIMSILTRVNYEVAFEFESLASNAEYSGKKQVPSVVSTLTKDFFFPPKNRVSQLSAMTPTLQTTLLQPPSQNPL